MDVPTDTAGPLTPEVARRLLALIRAEIRPGLSDGELDAVEERFGFRFAADHRVLLSAGLPVGGGWPDWRDDPEEKLRSLLDWPVDGVLFDVEHNAFWYPAWGERPTGRRDAVEAARAHLATVVRMVPVHSHRYLPGIAGQWGHPVLSMYQTDIICYGDDLADYLDHEFVGRRPRHTPTGVPTRPAPVATVPFWSWFLDEGEEHRTPDFGW